MDILNKLKLIIAGRLLNIPGMSLIPNTLYNFLGIKQKTKQVLPKNPTVHQLRNFAKNSIVRKPIKEIENTISRLPYKFTNINLEDTNDYKEQKEIVRTIIESPNLIHNRKKFLKMILDDILTIDGGCFEKAFGGDRKRPLFLYPTDGSTIQYVVPYDYTNIDSPRYAQQQPDGMKYYSAQQLAYIQSEVFTDRPQGLSPVLAAYNYITYLLNANERADGVASNATADFMIYFKGMDEPIRQKFIEYMQNEIEGTGAIPVAAGPDSVETKQIRAINKDMFCIDWQEFLMVIVALAFNYPPEKLGVTKANDRSTADDLDNITMRDCVKPYSDLIEDMYNEHVLKALGFDKLFKFEFIYEVTETEKTKKSDRITKQYITGVITQNQALVELGYPESDSKYADMTIKESTAKINVDYPSNNGGFNGVGSVVKDNYSDKPTNNKTDN